MCLPDSLTLSLQAAPLKAEKHQITEVKAGKFEFLYF